MLGRQKRLRNGEVVLTTVLHIEDTKGNPGDSGRLMCTNLRLIWYSLVHKKYNLCKFKLLKNLFIIMLLIAFVTAIGYGRIANINTRTVNNKTRGQCQALYILAISGNTRFEFLFTDVSGESERKNMPIFQNVFDIHR